MYESKCMYVQFDQTKSSSDSDGQFLVNSYIFAIKIDGSTEK
jgi:hypothetical protein